MAINLGDINFGLGPDTSRLQRARAQVLAFGQAVNRAAASQAEGARKVESGMRRQEKAMVDALNKTTKLNDSIRKTAGADRLLQATTNTYNRLAKELGNGQVSALQFQRSMEDFATSTARVQRQLQGIQTANKLQAETAKKAEKDLKAQEVTTTRLGRETFKASQQVERFQAAIQRSGAPSSLGTSAANALNQLNTGLSAKNLTPGARQQEVQAFQATMQRLRMELQKFQADANAKATTGIEGALRRMSDMAILVHGPLSGIATRLTLLSSLANSTTVAMAALTVGLSAGAYAFMKLGQGAVDAARIFDRLNQTMRAVTGNQAIAAAEMNYTRTVADRAGTQFETTSQQYGRLMAAAKGTNLEGEQTRLVFENIIFSAQKLGMANENLTGTLRAVEQILSKGRVTGEELRQQLGDRLPGAVQIMAQALGVTTKKMDEMMKKGQITSDILVKFSQTLAQRLGVDTSQAINTITASENRASNAFQRLNKAIDESIGFSKAYQATLELLTGSMNWLTQNLNTVWSIMAGIAGGVAGALALIYGPAVVAGFASLIAIIRSLTVGVMALNVAVLANPFAMAVIWMLRLGAVVAGAATGYYAMNAAVSGTANAHQSAIPSVQAYIAAQGNLQSSIRNTTQEYIKQQEVFAAGIQARMRDTAAALEQERENQRRTGLDGSRAAGQRRWGSQLPMNDEEFRAARERIESYDAQLRALGEDANRAAGDIKKLNDILARQTAVEQQRRDAVARGAAGDGKGEKSRAQIAIETANQDITRLKRELEILSMPPGMQGWAKMMDEVTKKVEDFREKLDKAKVPAGEAARLTNEYRASLERLSVAKYNLEQFPPLWNEIVRVMSSGMDTGMNKLVDDIWEGKNALQSLGDTAKIIIKDLIKSFLQLWALNPFKNWLFGGNPATGNLFPTLGGMGNTGGALGDLFKGIGSLFGFAKGGVFGGGHGVVSQPTLFGTRGGGMAVMGEKDNEAVMPLVRDGSGRLGVRSSGGGGDAIHVGITYQPVFTGTQAELDEFKTIYAQDRATMYYQVVAAVRKAQKQRMI